MTNILSWPILTNFDQNSVLSVILDSPQNIRYGCCTRIYKFSKIALHNNYTLIISETFLAYSWTCIINGFWNTQNLGISECPKVFQNPLIVIHTVLQKCAYPCATRYADFIGFYRTSPLNSKTLKTFCVIWNRLQVWTLWASVAYSAKLLNLFWITQNVFSVFSRVISY